MAYSVPWNEDILSGLALETLAMPMEDDGQESWLKYRLMVISRLERTDSAITDIRNLLLAVRDEVRDTKAVVTEDRRQIHLNAEGVQKLSLRVAEVERARLVAETISRTRSAMFGILGGIAGAILANIPAIIKLITGG